MDQNLDEMAPVSVRLPVALREQIRKRAQGNRRSLNSELVVMLEQRIAQVQKEGEAA